MAFNTQNMNHCSSHLNGVLSILNGILSIISSKFFSGLGHACLVAKLKIPVAFDLCLDNFSRDGPMLS